MATNETRRIARDFARGMKDIKTRKKRTAKEIDEITSISRKKKKQ